MPTFCFECYTKCDENADRDFDVTKYELTYKEPPQDGKECQVIRYINGVEHVNATGVLACEPEKEAADVILKDPDFRTDIGFTLEDPEGGKITILDRGEIEAPVLQTGDGPDKLVLQRITAKYVFEPMNRLTVYQPPSDAVPLAGLFKPFKDQEEMQFLDTIQPILDAEAISDIMEAAKLTLSKASERKLEGGDLAEDPLPVSNLCSILQFCDEATSSELNSICSNKDRRLIKPFLNFMWLVMKTLEMLAPYEGRSVYRTVTGDFKEQFPVGKEFCWDGFVSATPESSFDGISPAYTIFHIQLTQKQARDISKYSPFDSEIIIPPGCRFKVIDHYNHYTGPHIIVHEVRSLAWIIDLWPQTSESMQEVINIFTKIDLDGNQRLSKKELTTIMVEVGLEQSSAEMLIEMADKDRSGDLDFAEFVGWIFAGSDMAKEVKTKLQEPKAGGGDLQSVSVNTMSGDSHELKVATGIKASELRTRVAELLGIPRLETGLLDNADGTLIFFGDPAPMKVIPESVTLIRSKKWAGVPQGLHHEALTVSEDRCRVSHDGDYQNAGCYLTAALDRGSRYRIDIALEMDYNVHCVWLGVTSDRMTKWGYLEGCFFSHAGGYWTTVWDCFFAPRHGYSFRGGPGKSDNKTKVYETDKISEILSVPPSEGAKKLRMVLDMRNGSMELRTQEDELLVQHFEPEFLVEDALRICIAFLEPGAALTIEGCQAD